MDCETPVILAIVAVGAIARTFELRMPPVFMPSPQAVPVQALVQVHIKIFAAPNLLKLLQ